MNAQISHVAFGSIGALRGDAGTAPLALVMVDANTGRVYRWRPAALEPDDGAQVVKPTAVGSAEPGRWHLLDNIVLGVSDAHVLEAVPLTGDRAVVVTHAGWVPLGVTHDSSGPRLWLGRRLLDET